MQPHSEPVMQHGTAAFGVRFSPDSWYLASSAKSPGSTTNQFDPFTLKLWATNGNGWTEAAVAANLANGKVLQKRYQLLAGTESRWGLSAQSSRFYAAPDLQLITNVAPGSLPLSPTTVARSCTPSSTEGITELSAAIRPRRRKS